MQTLKTELFDKGDDILYFPLKRMSKYDSIFSDRENGIFSEKYKPIFTPIINKQLAVNTYYQNDLIAPANTRVSIDLLKVFDELKINFKVNRKDITHEERDHAFDAAMAQIIARKKQFIETVATRDIPLIQDTVKNFITYTIRNQKIEFFQEHSQEVKGYLEFAASILTSDDKYIHIASALKKVVETEKSLFKLGPFETGETIEHIIKTAWLSLILAREIGTFSSSDLKTLSVICIGHDGGKALMPRDIIYKQGRLSQLENDIMKSHVLFSYILSSGNQCHINFESFAMAMHHIKENKALPQSYSIAEDTHTTFFEYLTDDAKHEFNRVYEQTKPYYRIIGIADTFEAITAERVYKRASSVGQTLDIMIKNNRSQDYFYQPYLDIFIRYILKKFIPRHLKFQITDELLDIYELSCKLLSGDRKWLKKSCRGVVTSFCSDIEKPIECIIFQRQTLTVQFRLKVPPIYFLQHMYLN